MFLMKNDVGPVRENFLLFPKQVDEKRLTNIIVQPNASF